MNKKVLFILCSLFFSPLIFSQRPQKLSSGQIYEKIQKLNFLGTVLYVAAHPDDENTRLISYVSNHLRARVGYLSLTRGSGGQNLIGPEIGKLLGVIRTQELLEARKVDGGEQFFTRAIDFGYSKHPDETLEIWSEEVLSDVIWVIRTFKPDVIINRFDHRTPGTTHGHHTSSAILSVEAFSLAGDDKKFKDQLKYTDTWQPTRLFLNASPWFYKNQDEFKKATQGKLSTVDVGVYYPLKGLSNNEVAAAASSKHLCQGFGRLTTRGSQKEYMEFLKGVRPKDRHDIFSGINTTWSRLKNGDEIGSILYEVEKNFNFKNPAIHLKDLMRAYKKINALQDPHWRKIKREQIHQIIEACSGLYLEASTLSSYAVSGSKIELNIEALNRNSQVPVVLESMTFKTAKTLTVVKEIPLENNVTHQFKQTINLEGLWRSDPYWLRSKASLGMYQVENESLIGKPETPRQVSVFFNLSIDGCRITIKKDAVYRYSKRDKGELYEPFEILPPATVTLNEKVMLFHNSKERVITVQVRSNIDHVKGELFLDVSGGWTVSPISQLVEIKQKGGSKKYQFTLTPTKKDARGKVRASLLIDGEIYNKGLVEIEYPHITKKSILLESEASLIQLNIKKVGNSIGYIMGAGDAIPESLKQIGYDVRMINPKEMTIKNLKNFHAVVLGVRAYNTTPFLKYKQSVLLEYVKQGGTLVVQYNTNRKVDVMAPFALKLSRDRVTEENAKVTILEKNHPVVNFPNKITERDFEGWVQERGLYFPNTWSSEYTSILSMNDRGESPKKGSLLVAKYGRGNYVYTGLSFFRELPAGVTGAYKLFVNLLSMGRELIE